MHLILIDWEKAFDKVSQKGLFSALERMSINPKLINMIRELYKNPRYKVEMDGYTSNWHTQESGIRQGCPLSPYLFIMVLSVVFHDVNKDDHLNIERHRVDGALFDSILYADDTICASQNANSLTRMLHEIAIESDRYGLKLNQKNAN